MTIVPLNLPKAQLKLTRKNGVVHVRCLIRNKDLVCTPEEWVRQHVINYLILNLGKRKGLIAAEYELSYNGLKRRADVVVFDDQGKPEMLVECKATTVPLTNDVLHQAAQYNYQLGVGNVVLTNGLNHISCEINKEGNNFEFNEVWKD